VQILHPFAGSIQQYAEEIADPNRHRPTHCPQCQAQHPLTAHGFYSRTLVDAGFDGSIRVRRYLCGSCKRTVSLLPEFALPYLRFSVSIVSLFLAARLLQGVTLAAAAAAAAQVAMPYQRGQFWLRRFGRQAESLCAALTALAAPPAAPTFVHRALECCSPPDGSRLIVSCLPICDSTCWAGPRFSLRPDIVPRSARRPLPPEGPHTAFARSRHHLRPYASAQEIFCMDAKAEKVALFRYGLIAPLVLETLPRGELTRRA
jgi:transposase-like protein